MIISHVKIIAFQLEIPDLFLVMNITHQISHSFAALTLEISCSTLKINLVFPRTHVLFSIQYFKQIYRVDNLPVNIRIHKK